jgi:hypothetical protein
MLMPGWKCPESRAADRQEAHLGVGAERHQGGRADLDVVRAEQEVPLRVTDLPATRGIGLHEGAKRCDLRIITVDDAQKTTCCRRVGRLVEDDENGAVGIEGHPATALRAP